MIQGYILSILFLILSSLMFLQNKYRLELSMIIRFSTLLKEKNKYLYLFTLLGLLITAILIFMPVSPGPMVLGDIIPALMIFYETLYFYFSYRRDEGDNRKDYLDIKKEGRRVMLGYISLTIALFHFLFPGFVLL